MTVLAAHSETVRLRSPGTRPRRISVLGATGSIGENTLDLIGRDPSSYAVVALTGGRNAARLAELAVQHQAELAVIADESCYAELRARLAGTGIETAAGTDALVEAASRPADWVMAAIVGAAGLKPTLAAVRQGTCTALANKECLVSAGRIFMREVARYETSLLPVELRTFSRHAGDGRRRRAGEHRAHLPHRLGRSVPVVEPGRHGERHAETGARPSQLVHGPEGHHRFGDADEQGARADRGASSVLDRRRPARCADPPAVHRALPGLLSRRLGAGADELPDMRTPIAYSLAWPNRMQAPTARLDLASIGTLAFEAPDEARFPALKLAREVLAAGGSASTRAQRRQ